MNNVFVCLHRPMPPPPLSGSRKFANPHKRAFFNVSRVRLSEKSISGFSNHIISFFCVRALATYCVLFDRIFVFRTVSRRERPMCRSVKRSMTVPALRLYADFLRNCQKNHKKILNLYKSVLKKKIKSDIIY